jgi:hypothetical protein
VRSAQAAIRAFASNWAFGMPPNGVLRLLIGARLNDPIVKIAPELRMRFGGAKENDDYRRLQDCITAYLASDQHNLGVILNQNYGYMMQMETVSFRERYGFDTNAWLANHQELCEKYLRDSRTQLTGYRPS